MATDGAGCKIPLHGGQSKISGSFDPRNSQPWRQCLFTDNRRRTQSFYFMNEKTPEPFLSEAQKLLLKKTVCSEFTKSAKDLNALEFEIFCMQIERTRLDPFSRQIYPMVRIGSKPPFKRTLSIQATIDGCRLIAQRTGEYAGQVPLQWCGDDGIWKDVWLDKNPPSAARSGVYRKGFVEPLIAVATMLSYQPEIGPLWGDMPDVLIGKCAEMLALRKGFPQELSTVYIAEEMAQSEEPGKDTSPLPPDCTPCDPPNNPVPPPAKAPDQVPDEKPQSDPVDAPQIDPEESLAVKWQDFVITSADKRLEKVKGKKLGEMTPKWLASLQNKWKPVPVNGAYAEADLLLNNAIQQSKHS